MSDVTLNNEAIRRLFRDEEGPMGRYIARKTAEVTTYAHNNVLGRPGPRVRSTDLLRSLRFAGMFQDHESISGVVVADAQHDGVNYPVLLELGGVTPSGKYYRYPFLTPAIEQAGFTRVS